MTSILILAGRRDGKVDEFARAAGVSHKCLIPVAGRPMIEYPLAAAAALGGKDRARILISIDAPGAIAANPLVSRLAIEGRAEVIRSASGLTQSIVQAAERASFPMIVTTADNVLLSAATLAEFAATAEASGDAAVAFARKEAVLAAHPDGQRRFYAFADGEYSNCNLYWVRNREALLAARIFRGGGQFAKHPARILAAFGLLNLIRFRLRLLSLEGAMAKLSRSIGMEIRAIEMRDGRLAIDVDNDRTLGVASEILARDAGMLATAA